MFALYFYDSEFKLPVAIGTNSPTRENPFSYRKLSADDKEKLRHVGSPILIKQFKLFIELPKIRPYKRFQHPGVVGYFVEKLLLGIRIKIFNRELNRR